MIIEAHQLGLDPSVDTKFKYLVAFHPLIQDITDRWKIGRPQESSYLPLFLPALLSRLLVQAQRTFLLEWNIAQLRGRLSAESSEESLNQYVAWLSRDDNRKSFLAEYPLLAEATSVAAEQWLFNTHEFLQHLEEDRTRLETEFGIKGPLSNWEADAGDRHVNGRTVTFASFACGTRLVYKPRSLEIDEHFQTVLRWINETTSLDLKTIKIFSTKNHGWVEFVPFVSCTTLSELTSFYQRQGGLLALCHALAATDMHAGNLIASGSHPVLIDLETLFHPRLSGEEITCATDRAAEDLGDSVLAVGLIPSGYGIAHSFDVSGIGGKGGQATPFKVLRIEHSGAFLPRVVRTSYQTPEMNNQPDQREVALPPAKMADALLAGFDQVYSSILANRASFLSALEAFRNVRIRVVLRPTMTYDLLRVESWHPNFLRTADAKFPFGEKLSADFARRPVLQKIFSSELRQLNQGDVPYFSSAVDSLDLFGGDETLAEGALAQSGMARAQARIRSFSPSQLELQHTVLAASFPTLQPESEAFIKGDDEIEIAIECGEKLLGSAITHNNFSTWLTHEDRSEGEHLRSNLVPADFSLYEGTTGICLFLAYLAKTTNRPEFKAVAMRAWNNSLADYERFSAPASGGFSGRGGLLYTAAHLYSLWGSADLLRIGEELLRGLEPPDEPSALDIISGAAGTILNLLAWHAIKPESEALTLAGKHAEIFLSPWVEWCHLLSIHRGFSHGLSGIIHALGSLGKFEHRFLARTHELVKVEDDLLASGWTDRNHHGGIHQATWCHGAPGIFFSRAALGLAPSPIASSAFAQTIRSLPSQRARSHGLCHGFLGNFDTLLAARNFAPWRAEDRAKIEKELELFQIEVRERGWRSAHAFQTASSGLMVGLAGLGLGFLRAWRTNDVPSLLYLSPPAAVIS